MDEKFHFLKESDREILHSNRESTIPILNICFNISRITQIFASFFRSKKFLLKIEINQILC